MYTEIRNPRASVFDGVTNEYLGEATWQLPQESTQKLLDLVNYQWVPSTLLVLNSTYYPVSDAYKPLTLYQPTSRKAILHALFRDAATGAYMPIDITFRYSARANSGLGYPYFYYSILFDQIAIESIRPG